MSLEEARTVTYELLLSSSGPIHHWELYRTSSALPACSQPYYCFVSGREWIWYKCDQEVDTQREALFRTRNQLSQVGVCSPELAWSSEHLQDACLYRNRFWILSLPWICHRSNSSSQLGTREPHTCGRRGWPKILHQRCPSCTWALPFSLYHSRRCQVGEHACSSRIREEDLNDQIVRLWPLNGTGARIQGCQNANIRWYDGLLCSWDS